MVSAHVETSCKQKAHHGVSSKSWTCRFPDTADRANTHDGFFTRDPSFHHAGGATGLGYFTLFDCDFMLASQKRPHKSLKILVKKK